MEHTLLKCPYEKNPLSCKNGLATQHFRKLTIRANYFAQRWSVWSDHLFYRRYSRSKSKVVRNHPKF